MNNKIIPDPVKPSKQTITPSFRTSNKNIPLEKILELRNKNLSHSQIAELLGCDTSNVTRRLAPYRETINNLDRFRNHKADILAIHQQRLLSGITAAKLKSAPLGALTLSFAQLYDKERLERGQSTENISIKSIVDSLDKDRLDLNQRKVELLRVIESTDSVTPNVVTGDDNVSKSNSCKE